MKAMLPRNSMPSFRDVGNVLAAQRCSYLDPIIPSNCENFFILVKGYRTGTYVTTYARAHILSSHHTPVMWCSVNSNKV